MEIGGASGWLGISLRTSASSKLTIRGSRLCFHRTTDDDAVFERETISARGPHGGFRAPQPAIAFRLTEGTLDRGSSVTITYGDRRQGGPGIRIPTFESERLPLPLYVDLDGSSEWRTLPITPFVTSGGRATGVHAFGPSVVEPGEIFELSVRAEDQYFNRGQWRCTGFRSAH